MSFPVTALLHSDQAEQPAMRMAAQLTPTVRSERRRDCEAMLSLLATERVAPEAVAQNVVAREVMREMLARAEKGRGTDVQRLATEQMCWTSVTRRPGETAFQGGGVMRRRQFILAGLSATIFSQTACDSGSAVTPPPSRGFTDTFDGLNDDRWTPGEPHTLGRSEIHPENVAVADGQLRLEIPGERLAGAELRTVATLPSGTSRARIKVPDCPDSVTGFFLYTPPDYAHEVDIELYNRPGGRARLTTYDGGKLTRTAEFGLPFDPTAGFHDYAIALAADTVEFYTDGHLLTAWSGGVPSEPMNLYLNAWYPAWLGGTSTPVDTAVVVDSVSFTPR